MTCPNCHTELDPAQYGLTEEELNGKVHCSLDCHKCRSLLLIRDGKLMDFHKAIHERCPSWPEDGKGTMAIELGED